MRKTVLSLALFGFFLMALAAFRPAEAAEICMVGSFNQVFCWDDDWQNQTGGSTVTVTQPGGTVTETPIDNNTGAATGPTTVVSEPPPPPPAPEPPAPPPPSCCLQEPVATIRIGEVVLTNNNAPSTTARVSEWLAEHPGDIEGAANAALDYAHSSQAGFPGATWRQNPDGSITIIFGMSVGGVDCNNSITLKKREPEPESKIIIDHTKSPTPTNPPTGTTLPPSGQAPPTSRTSGQPGGDDDEGGFIPPSALLDAAASFISGSWNKQAFNIGEQATAKVRVSNLSSGSAAIPATRLGVWPTGSPLPNCPTSPQTPPSGQNYNVPGIPAGDSREIDISFNVPAVPGSYTAHAYAVPQCDIDDVNWGNNGTNSVLNVSFGYTVNLNAWFETISGDVGSQGAVSVSQTPPAGKYQSSYLLAGQNIGANVQSQKWTINNYTSQLVPTGGVYNYLAERFLGAAKASPGRGCNIASGSAAGFNYCGGDAEFNSAGAPGGNSVWFIDGNLTIKKNLTLAGGDSATFIVAGNIIVNTDVNRIDGIYVSGGTFSDVDASGSLGRQLVINGGVYANAVNLPRKLGGSLCPSGVQCDNTVTPANQFVFDPKYLVGLNNIIGTPSISWTETAP